MKLVRAYLKIEIVWADSDMLELRLAASNESFAGEANFYAKLGEASIFAKQIEGFPRTATDTREYKFGDTSMHGYGGATIRLHCIDHSGHLGVQVEVHKNSMRPKQVAQSAIVQLSTVPAEIDSFVEQLLRMKDEVGSVATLQNS